MAKKKNKRLILSSIHVEQINQGAKERRPSACSRGVLVGKVVDGHSSTFQSGPLFRKAKRIR
jgi:hypothetical protein